MRNYEAGRRVRPRLGDLLTAVLAITAMAPLAAQAQTPTIVELNTAGSVTTTLVDDLSLDGSTTAGSTTIIANGINYQAARWNAAGAVTNLPDLGASSSNGRRSSNAHATSADGSVTVGISQKYSGSFFLGTMPVRWNASGAVEELASLEWGSSGTSVAIPLLVSGDGSKIAGRAERYTHNGGPAVGSDAVVWNSSGSALPLTNAGGASSGLRFADVDAISWDGAIVAGRWNAYTPGGVPQGVRPVKWNSSGVPIELPALAQAPSGVANGEIRALSKYGEVAFGCSRKYDVAGVDLGQFAVRWDALNVIHEIVLPGTNGVALGCSDLGDAAFGTYVDANGTSRGFRWTLAPGATDLGSLSAGGECIPRDFSRDGSTVVGFSATADSHGAAFIWQDGAISSLWNLLADRYQVNPATFGWQQFDEALFCSADGKTIVGRGTKTIAGASAFFRVTIPSNAPPTIESSLAVGQTYVVPLGSTFTATFVGKDNDGDDLALEASGLPGSAVLTPPAESVSPAPTTATLTFAPVKADVGDHAATIAFRDESGEAASISFTLRVPANQLPAATAPTPEIIECRGEQNIVTLSTTVTDADPGHLLTVAWSVGDRLIQTDVGVVPGSVVEFEHDYPHYTSVVTVEVSDGYDATSASGAVIVQDTIDPWIGVVRDIVVPTDLGRNFAIVALPLPEVFDVCDEEPTLTNDAPEVYPVGATLVTWTAVDEFLNEATVTQLVTVEDREAPEIVGASDATVPVDQGEIFATVDLPEPEAFDNVTVDVAIESDSPTVFPLGETLVTWTATDAAGNETTWSLTVTVVNQAPVADAGDAVSIEAGSASGTAVTLNGTGSFDSDGHDLRYSWSATGVTFDDPTSSTPSGTFPVGETHVTLVVTDEADASVSAETIVTVTYDPVQSVIETRTYGPAASALVAQSRTLIAAIVVREPRNGLLIAAFQAANQAAAYDATAAAIEFDDAGDYAAALQMYRVLRARQSQASARAAALVLLGRLLSPQNGASDAEFASAFQAATNAALYGMADATQP